MPDPREDPLVVEQRARAPAAGHDEHVGLGDVLEDGVDMHGEALVVGPDRADLVADECELRVGQPGENLVRADRVEGGEAVIQRDGDLHGRIIP